MKIFSLPIFLCGQAVFGGDSDRKNPATCDEQIAAEIAKHPIENGEWECVPNESGGLTSCRQVCEHGGRTKATIRCRAMTRVMKTRKMDQQDCAAVEWKQAEKGKCSDLPPYKIAGKKGKWECEMMANGKESMNLVSCTAACPHLELPTVTCRPNRGEWSELPKRYDGVGLRCEKPKPKCTEKDRVKAFPIEGAGSWQCKETDDAEHKARAVCQVACESGEQADTAEIFCSTKGSSGWRIKTEGSMKC